MGKSDLISTFGLFMMPRRARILKDSSMRDDINKPAECFSEGLHQQVLVLKRSVGVPQPST